MPVKIIKLLYIEDNAEHVDMIRHVLIGQEHVRFKVKHTGNIRSSIKYLKSVDCDVDVILMDLMLPNSEGVNSFLRIYKACTNVPIVIMSAYENIAIECISLGAEDYLVKPVMSPDILYRSLRFAIERRKHKLLEKRFSDALKLCPWGVHIYELKGNDFVFVGYNDAAEKILNFDHSGIIGKTMDEVFPGAFIDEIKEKYNNVIKTGNPISFVHIPCADTGQEGVFNIHAFRTTGNRIACSFEDVEEKMKLEARFQRLSEAAFEGIVISRNGVVVDANDQFCEMSGYTYDEVVGLHIFEFAHPDYKEIVKRNVKNNYEEPYEGLALRKDGSSFPVELRGRNLPDGTRLSAVRDLTSYKEAEKNLREAKEKFENLVEVTRAAIYEIDLVHAKFTYVNDVMCRLTGYSREELLNNMSAFDLLTSDSKRMFIDRLERMKKGEWIDPTFEYEVIIKDGSIKNTLITVEFKENKVGKVVAANVVAIDLTEQRKAEEEAKIKEELIFNQLEERIRQWRDELTSDTESHQYQLQQISKEIESMDRFEVE